MPSRRPSCPYCRTSAASDCCIAWLQACRYPSTRHRYKHWDRPRRPATGRWTNTSVGSGCCIAWRRASTRPCRHCLRTPGSCSWQARPKARSSCTFGTRSYPSTAWCRVRKHPYNHRSHTPSSYRRTANPTRRSSRTSANYCRNTASPQECKPQRRPRSRTLDSRTPQGSSIDHSPSTLDTRYPSTASMRARKPPCTPR